MTIRELNSLTASAAMQVLLECCGSREWATELVGLRPFPSVAALLNEADRAWLQLGDLDWLEAFGAHPRIGESLTSDVAKREQQVALTAAQDVKEKLARANQEYEQRFGFIFIVFATGKTSERMLEILRGRMNNDRDTEIRNAAAEQMKITRLRLQRLLEQDHERPN